MLLLVIAIRLTLGPWDGSTTGPVVTTADGNDWGPDISPGGSIAFGSDVSGSNESWTKRPGEDPVRLTQLRGSYIHAGSVPYDGLTRSFYSPTSNLSRIGLKVVTAP